MQFLETCVSATLEHQSPSILLCYSVLPVLFHVLIGADGVFEDGQVAGEDVDPIAEQQARLHGWNTPTRKK